MSRNTAMGLGGLAAIFLDFIIVASFVGLLLLKRWIGAGLDFDLMTLLIVSYAVIGWFCGKRLIEFFSSKDLVVVKSPVHVHVGPR
jgi:hypothetical protein